MSYYDDNIRNTPESEMSGLDRVGYLDHPSDSRTETYRGESNNDYSDNSNGNYSGKTRWGKPHGKGTGYFINGDSYEGEWRKGLPHGRGRYSGTDHSGNSFVYEGEFQKGYKHGRGVLFTNGQKYQTVWKKDVMKSHKLIKKWLGIFG